MTIDFDSPFLIEHVALLCTSYRHWTGDDLLAVDISPADAVRALYVAPFAVVSHDTQSDPVFNYGNRMALQLFEMTWDDFTKLPSRLSTQQVNQNERNRLLAQVNTQGYSDQYTGIRITKTGRQFMIRAATVWNIIEGEGHNRGQAALIREWRALT